MRSFPSAGFYGIISDPQVGHVSMAAAMVRLGLRCIQLRMKDVPRRELLNEARAVRSVIPGDRLFIVNDDPFVAQQVGADGVHLGQGDASYAEARRLLGARAIIGLSTHNSEQVLAACALRPDYIGVGPVFPTKSKADAERALGLATMGRMIALADVPAVAIGGIRTGNLAAVLAAGARIVCAMGEVNSAPNPDSVLQRFVVCAEGSPARGPLADSPEGEWMRSESARARPARNHSD